MVQLKIIYFTSLFLMICFLVKGQDTYKPQKLKNSKILIDGIIDNNEWDNAQKVILDYEVNPGNNITPKENTTAFITYTDTHLYVGIYAYANPEEARASVRSRDDFGMILFWFALTHTLTAEITIYYYLMPLAVNWMPEL